MVNIIQHTDERWSQFIRSNPSATIFHHQAWSKLLSESYGFSPFVIVIEDSKGEITAGVPMMESTHLLVGKTWKALPFTDQCAPVFSNRRSLEELTDFLIYLSEQYNVRRMEIRANLSFNSTFHPTSSYVIHKLSLHPDLSSVYEEIYKMHTRNIKIAERNKVDIKIGSDLDDLREFYGLHVESRKRQGIPVQPWRFFVSLYRNLVYQGLGFFLEAYSGSNCIASALFLHWGKTLTYKYGASNAMGRKLRANNLLFWNAIKWGYENNFSILDFRRTANSNQGLKDFKSRWGAEEIPLVYSHIPRSQRRNSNRKFLRITRTLIRNSPSWVCRMIGEILYKFSE